MITLFFSLKFKIIWTPDLFCSKININMFTIMDGHKNMCFIMIIVL